MTIRLYLASLVIVAIARGQTAQKPLSAAAFAELAKNCAPDAPLATLRSIATVESAFNPLALSINYPEAVGPQLGLGQGKVELARQPANLKEAVGWARWFVANGQTVSVGLLQLNIEHLAGFKISLEDAFDPCTNLRIGWGIFNTKYQAAAAVLGKGQSAMHAALSAYNSGSLIGGFSNGYVAAVLAAAPPEEPEIVEPPVIPESDAEQPKQKSAKMFPVPEAPKVNTEAPPNPRTTPTKVVWDLTRAAAPWIAAKD